MNSQAIQDIDEFVSSSLLEKCSIRSLAHQWMLCSEWVPSEWESKQLIKTSQSQSYFSNITRKARDVKCIIWIHIGRPKNTHKYVYADA